MADGTHNRFVVGAAASLLVLSVVGCAGRKQAERQPGVALAQVARGSNTAPATAPRGPATTQELQRSLRGTEWTRLPTSSRVVALTVDAGSNADGAQSILRTLAAKHAAATFFLTGRWAEEFPATARTIASRYPVGNHTYSHPYLTRLSNAAVGDQVRRGARAIGAATSVDPRPLFRFPYGDRDARTIAVVNGLGYGNIRWTVDTLGWEGTTGGQSVQTVINRTLAGLRPGEIVLMHLGSAPDGSTLDADALPALIDAIRARGYTFTTVYAYAARYAQVADDASTRFSASASWKRASWNRERYGRWYRYARPAAAESAAGFRLKVPQASSYRVYAWWPSNGSYNARVTISLETAAGLRRVVVDERRNGGRWRLLGTFPLVPGDRVLARVSRRSSAAGLVIADAFRIATPPPPGRPA